MKNDDSALSAPARLVKDLHRLFDGALARADTLTLARSGQVSGSLRYGFHSHDAWEIFCALRGALSFELAGQSPVTFGAGTMLIVPPGCLHMSIDMLPQQRNLRMLIMNLPGTDGAYGSVYVGGVPGGFTSTFTAQDLTSWTELLGESPEAVMRRVERALDQGTWGRQRALGHLRVLFAAYAGITTEPDQRYRAKSERRVTEALSFLQGHYYESDLSLSRIGAAVGFSPSHLSSVVRRTTGQTIRQMLIDLRLRRAMTLLTDTRHTIKEIAALTGWSHQLYFSAAFRKRHGKPPSAFR
jgi:AraC-like DNA-binding protein